MNSFHEMRSLSASFSTRIGKHARHLFSLWRHRRSALTVARRDHIGLYCDEPQDSDLLPQLQDEACGLADPQTINQAFRGSWLACSSPVLFCKPLGPKGSLICYTEQVLHPRPLWPSIPNLTTTLLVPRNALPLARAFASVALTSARTKNHHEDKVSNYDLQNSLL